MNLVSKKYDIFERNFLLFHFNFHFFQWGLIKMVSFLLYQTTGVS